MKKTLILIVLLFSVYSSFSQKALNDEQIKKYLPKKEIKYKLSRKTYFLADTAFVSLNAIYLNSEYLCGNGCDTFYTYLRFFEDGRVFFSFSYMSNPTKEELNDFSYGKFGRYIIQKDSIITIELYQDRYTGIEFLHAKKTENGIQFFSHGVRNPKCIFNKKDTSGGYYEKKYL